MSDEKKSDIISFDLSNWKSCFKRIKYRRYMLMIFEDLKSMPTKTYACEGDIKRLKITIDELKCWVYGIRNYDSEQGTHILLKYLKKENDDERDIC